MGSPSVVTSRPQHAPGARWLAAALVGALALAGCKKGDDAPAPAPGTEAPKAEPGTRAAASAPPSAESLSPLIREFGPDGAVPNTLMLEFSRAIHDEDSGAVRPGTRLTITPPVSGMLVHRGRSALAFTPTDGFAPGTQYTVVLEALETHEGLVRSPGTDAWRSQFTTPAFAFLRVAPQAMDVSKGSVEAALVFSAPVDATVLRKYAAFEVNGQPVANVKLRTKTGERNVVTAQLSHPRLKLGSTVRFVLKPGLTALAGPRTGAAGAEGSFSLVAGKRVDITHTAMKEGNTGYYIEVSCRDVDTSAPPSQTMEDEDEYDPYYYDSANLGCVLDDGVAADAIQFKPKVKFSVAPSRRGFRIFGDFKRGTYALRINGGTSTVGGGTLLASYEESFSVSARQPQLSFTSAGRYLPRSAWRNLPLNHLNVDSVELTVRHVPPENLVYWMSQEGRENADERTSNVIAKKKLSLQGTPDALVTTYLDVGSLVPATTKGVVELAAFHEGRRATSRILLTNLSLVAKRGGPAPGSDAKEEVWVWALGMESTEPLSGVEVSLVKMSGQSVARCTTQAEQGCRLVVPKSELDAAEPFALIARQGEDLTYLKYSELRTEIADSEVQGEPYRSQVPYRASLWSDRGVYRPGDTAHIAAVLRDPAHVAPPSGLPVQMIVTDPRERELRKVTLKTNEAGLVALDVPFAAFQDTGRYRVALKVADREVADYALNVEEFVPERMKVTARAEKPGYSSRDEVPVMVEAAYLFGGSAEKSPLEVTCRLESSSFKPKENANFTYGVWRQGSGDVKPLPLGQVKGELDAKGQAVLTCPAQQAAGGFKGAARLVAQASVFEAGSGRSTLGELTVPMHPEAYYLGLQSGAQKVSAGKAFTVSGVVVDWNGALVTNAKALQPVEVEYLRLEEEYGSYYDESEGDERYQRYLRPVREGRSTVTVADGRFSLTVTPASDAAGYLVRVKSGNAQTDLQLEGSGRYYWWGGSMREDQTPRPLKPASLALTLPRSAKVGEAVTVTVKAPHRGRMLFTAETDRVLAAEWKAVEPGEVSWTFTPSSFAPNVYVSAFLVKDPHLESAQAFMPDRAFGVSSMPLEPVAFTQEVKLEVPSEVRSNGALTVGLDLGPQEAPTFATVAVVDEGILSLTRFQSPDPLKTLFAQRALGVETYETLGWTLLVPPAGNSRSTGGDIEGGAAGRVQPVKPVALWSGVVAVPASGKVRVPFQLPQYRGAVRVMAVTASAQRIGRASAQVLVRDPLVLQATLPRFLSQNDEFQVPVFVTNLSGKAQDVKVSLTAEVLPVPGMAMPASVESPLKLLGKSEGRVRLENGKAATLVFQARAVQAVGAARLKVTAEGGGHTSFEQLDVPLLPAGPRERQVKRVELAEGKVDLGQYLQGWVPTTERTTFWVTANPYAESFNHLSYLVQYPYGCIEQTTSSTRPLLYVSELVESVDPTATANAKVEDMVMSGINRVFSMQTATGGFAYWPGSTEPVVWGTAYATHMLLDAQKLKYAVPQDRLNDALEWMSRELDRSEGHVESDLHSPGVEAEPYVQYVMALAGKGRKARVQKLIEELHAKPTLTSQQREHAYLLKAALYLSGDRRYEKDLRNPDLTPVTEERHNSWSFYSDRRRKGLTLSTFQDLFGNDASGEPLALQVAESLQGRRSAWYTTQELMWGVTGLGKRVKGAAQGFEPPVLSEGGKAVAARQEKNGRAADRTWALARASERKDLSLEVKQKGEGRLYLIVNSDGVRTGGQVRAGGEGLVLTRTFHKLDGTALNVVANPVNLADLIYVRVDIQNKTSEKVQNIALVDRLPAGWEIENARLGRGGGVDWVEQDALWAADYVNIRDDRIEMFGSLAAGERKSVVYAVRAVTAGGFTLPPVEAEAMYDPRIWAREVGGQVQVAGPWKDSLL
ncbi:alpha-2-macroglobulin family protein [Myxococcaceae bacterium GXIMD 01537]